MGNYDPDAEPPPVDVAIQEPEDKNPGSMDHPSVRIETGIHGFHQGDASVLATAGGVTADGSYRASEQSIRSLEAEAREATAQGFQRRLPGAYRELAAEYFELLAAEDR
jgi:hypothetical protein